MPFLMHVIQCEIPTILKSFSHIHKNCQHKRQTTHFSHLGHNYSVSFQDFLMVVIYFFFLTHVLNHISLTEMFDIKPKYVFMFTMFLFCGFYALNCIFCQLLKKLNFYLKTSLLYEKLGEKSIKFSWQDIFQSVLGLCLIPEQKKYKQTNKKISENHYMK